jgi:hypothetical protein
MSDLHLESTRGWDLPSVEERPGFDVLIVAGDLIPQAERGVRWLLERVPDRPLLYIMGNHESYGTDVDRTLEKARQAAAGTSLRILQDDAEMIGDVLFVGTTFWTDFELFGNRSYAMRRARRRHARLSQDQEELLRGAAPTGRHRRPAFQVPRIAPLHRPSPSEIGRAHTRGAKLREKAARGRRSRMLVVIVELVPAGFSPIRRTIASMRISNVSDLADVSDYRVEAEEGANPLTGDPPRRAECLVPAHARRQSVWALLQRACEKIMEE